MTIFVEKRHGHTESDSRPEEERTVKGILENEGTILRFPEGFLSSLYFAEAISTGFYGLAPHATTEEVVLAHGNLVRTSEDAKATHIALDEILRVNSRIVETQDLQERDLGSLANQRHSRLREICKSQGIHHRLFYERDFECMIKEYGGIAGDDYGETFGQFIGKTWELMINLLRQYQRPQDVVVLHTHSLRSVAISNVLHQIAYWAFLNEDLMDDIYSTTKQPFFGFEEHKFDPEKHIDLSFAARVICDPQGGYRWTELGYGEYHIIDISRLGNHMHITEHPAPSIKLKLDHKLRPSPGIDEELYLEKVRPLHDAALKRLGERRTPTYGLEAGSGTEVSP